MTVAAPVRVESPYKFLDSYDVDDAEIFFGRDREIRILLADVVVGRLVVLFARTGTGKTSLINAGVRPLLRQRGYASFFIRVGDDPAESAREQLREHPEITRLSGSTFPEQLSRLSARLGEPVVLFFDQFEEFFVRTLEAKPEAAAQFVSDVGDVYRDTGSGVHLVFSMREEFFVEMDRFRDEIPTIFHNESSLRLRWFDLGQAEEAIERPAAARGVRLPRKLVERLLDDLAERGEVEPARLQIVCDTLWRESGGRPTLARYEQLGRDGRAGNVSNAILNRRLEQRFERLRTREELDLLYELVPLLKTDRVPPTKYVRDFHSLVSLLGADRSALEALLAELEGSGLIRKTERENEIRVELTHDYLVERLDDVRASIRTIWPRRVLRRALESGEGGPELVADLAQVLERPEELVLEPAEGKVLLRQALKTGRNLRPAFDAAERAGVRVWGLLGDVIERRAGGEIDEAVYAVHLLAEIGSPRARRLLTRALDFPELAQPAIESLARFGDTDAVRQLRKALDDPRLAPFARDALYPIARSRRDTQARHAAAKALATHFRRTLELPAEAEETVLELRRLDSPDAVHLLADALLRPHLAAGARDSLLYLCRSPDESVARLATDVLIGSLEEELANETTAPEAIALLGALPSRRAVDLLAGELEREESRAALASAALDHLTLSPRLEVADRAAQALSRAPVLRPAAPLLTKAAPTRKHRTAASEVLLGHLSVVARGLVEGRVVPVLGLGVNCLGRPPVEHWEPGTVPPGADELAEFLAARFSYPPTGARLDLAAVAQHAAAVAGGAVVEETLADALAPSTMPNDAHVLFARLPEIFRRHGVAEPPLLFTAAYDDGMERALLAGGEALDVVSYVRTADGGPFGRGGFAWVREDGGGTRVVKLGGGVVPDASEPPSFAVTEDDFIGYPLRDALAPGLAAQLAVGHPLFLGLSTRAWHRRLLVERLLYAPDAMVTGWAVEPEASVEEKAFWQSRGIELLDLPLDEYVHALEEHVERVAAGALFAV